MTESGNAINVNACVPIAACQSQVKSSQVESHPVKSRQVPIVFVSVSVFVFAMWAMAAAAGAAPAAAAATTH